METGRLRLRTWTPELGSLLDKHCNTAAVMAHLGGPTDRATHLELVDWLIHQQAKHGTTFWAMERKRDGEFLGFCGLVIVDEDDSTVLGATEIGWRLRADEQGKSYAKEAAIACLYHAFEVQHVQRVVSRTVLANAPSWGLMRALGMRPDPRLDYLPKDNPSEALIVHVATHKDWRRIRNQHPDPRTG